MYPKSHTASPLIHFDIGYLTYIARNPHYLHTLISLQLFEQPFGPLGRYSMLVAQACGAPGSEGGQKVLANGQLLS